MTLKEDPTSTPDATAESPSAISPIASENDARVFTVLESGDHQVAGQILRGVYPRAKRRTQNDNLPYSITDARLTPIAVDESVSLSNEVFATDDPGNSDSVKNNYGQPPGFVDK